MEAKDPAAGADRKTIRFLHEVIERLNPSMDNSELNDTEQAWYEAVEEAHEEWQRARKYFENVSDPELVDHAIHMMSAAEKKFCYVLNQVRTRLDDDCDCDVVQLPDIDPNGEQ